MKVMKQVGMFCLFVMGLAAVDFILGSGCIQGVIPHSVFLLANIPFGIVYVVLETSVVDSHYQFAGHFLTDDLAGNLELLAVVAQAALYCSAWILWQRKRASKTTIQPAPRPVPSKAAADGVL